MILCWLTRQGELGIEDDEAVGVSLSVTKVGELSKAATAGTSTPTENTPNKRQRRWMDCYV